MEPCPVCGCRFSVSELQEHVQLHFLEEDAPAPAAAGAAAAAPSRIVIDSDEEDKADRVCCPMGCGAMVLLEDLDSHEEAHRLQEQLESQQRSLQQEQEAAEFEKLQMKFGFSDKRPGKCHRCGEEGHWARDCPSNPAAQAARARQPLTTNPSKLARLQQPDPVMRHTGDDVMALLQACFQAQQKPRTTVYLSGPVTFCCRGQADAGWGCGYRNIQMQVSHLLLTSPQHRAALFGGAGFIPDIPALQAWLEAAWQAGFDPGGAAMLGAAVQCTRKWIGTTEAAAMLRYFGCRALIVEFYGKSEQSGEGPTVHQGVACDLCGVSPIVGVRFKSYSTPDFDVCSTCSTGQRAQQHAPFSETGSAGGASASSAPRQHQAAAAAAAAAVAAASARPGPGSGTNGQQQGRGKRKQPSADERRQGASPHHALAEWIYAYFSSPGFQGAPAAAAGQQQHGSQATLSAAAGQPGTSSISNPVNAFTRLQQRPTTVVMTGKPPLYFQHEGHSRTIVGIERSLPPGPQQQQQQHRPPAAAAAAASGADGGGSAVEYSLIVLDPGMPQGELFNSLRSRDRWQMKVKRGMHSLARHSELQLLYVAPGVVPQGPERDALKRVVAAERYR